MKLESLKSSKFDGFKSHQIDNPLQIRGGGCIKSVNEIENTTDTYDTCSTYDNGHANPSDFNTCTQMMAGTPPHPIDPGDPELGTCWCVIDPANPPSAPIWDWQG